MMIRPRSLVLRYGAALGAVGLAFVLTRLISPLWQRESFIPFFGAVAFGAWYGGRGPGLVASLLAAFLFDYFIYPPPFLVSLEPQALALVFFFLAFAVAISSLTNGLARAEEAARERQQLLEVTLASIGDAVVATDADGRVMFINPAAQKVIGSPGKAGTPAAELLKLSSTAPDSAKDPIASVLKDGRALDLSSDAFSISGQGRQVPIEGNAAPIRHADGRLMGVVLGFRDVTERERTRAQILEYQQRLRSLAAELSLAEERQRREIATGLHDRIGQTLALSKIKLGTLREKLSDPEAYAQAEEVAALLKQVITEVRSLTFELSPPILYEFGLEAGLEWLAENMRKQYELPCSFEHGGDKLNLRQEEFVPLFQATRELLLNVAKHAHAKKAAVRLDTSANDVRVSVTDDGVGFDAATTVLAPDKAGGFGLFNIRERIQYLGGTFDLRSFPGQGTQVAMSLPVNR